MKRREEKQRGDNRRQETGVEERREEKCREEQRGEYEREEYIIVRLLGNKARGEEKKTRKEGRVAMG